MRYGGVEISIIIRLSAVLGKRYNLPCSEMTPPAKDVAPLDTNIWSFVGHGVIS